jgi:hypothetical protein
MIISPRAKKVIDILRKIGDRWFKIDEVFLYRRAGVGAPYRKESHWKRDEDAVPIPPPKWTSFAIVPEMTAAPYRGFGVYADVANAWRAFDRNVQTSGQFGNEAIVSFPEARLVKGFAIQFASSWGTASLAIEGKFQSGNWTRLFESTGGFVNNGRYDALTTPMLCTAVRVLTNSTAAVRSCQFFDALPLVPMSMVSNVAAGVRLVSEPENWFLH